MAGCKWYDVGCAAQWIKDEIQAAALAIYDKVLAGLAAVIEAFPVPAFFSQVQSFQMPPGVAFFVSALEIPAGLGIIVGAYTARFILRRIPGIG